MIQLLLPICVITLTRDPYISSVLYNFSYNQIVNIFDIFNTFYYYAI